MLNAYAHYSILPAAPYTELAIIGAQRMAQTRRMGCRAEGPSYQKRRGFRPTATRPSPLCARSRRSHVTSHAVPQISPYPLEPSSRLLQSRPDSRRSCPLKARATENRTRALNDRAILATQQNSAENVPRTARVAESSLVLRCWLA